MKIKNRFYTTKNETFQAIGFNYHPSKAGCRLFADKWDPVEVAKDFQKIKSLGFNTIRFFLFWQIFEPERKNYNQAAFLKLTEFVRIAREEGIFLIPTMINGWMSGVCFDVPWRQGRCLYTGEMLEAGCEYVGKVAQMLKVYDDVILSYDLGNEVVCFGGSSDQTTIGQWTRQLSQAIKANHPAALVTIGSAHDGAVLDTGFSYPAQQVDFYCTHGYPLWSPFNIESIESSKSAMYLSFLTAFGKTFGSLMVQEFGSPSSWANDEIIARYYQRVLYSTWAAGACGWLAWCWKDFTATDEPYESGGIFETYCGVTRTNGELKPQGVVFSQFASAMKELANWQPVQAEIGLYIPKQYFQRGDGLGESRIEKNAVSMFNLYQLCKRLHRSVEIFRDDNWSRYKMVIFPACWSNLCWSEFNTMTQYLNTGGHAVFVNSGSTFFQPENVLGITSRDIGMTNGTVCLVGKGKETFLKIANHPLHCMQPTLTDSLKVLYSDAAGQPVIVDKTVGQGKFTYFNLPLELALNHPHAMEADEILHSIYDTLFIQAGIKPLGHEAPEVEMVELENIRTAQRKLLKINHAAVQGDQCVNIIPVTDSGLSKHLGVISAAKVKVE
jgi:hypothetical protein